MPADSPPAPSEPSLELLSLGGDPPELGKEEKKSTPDADERKRQRLRLSRLEADMAYFQARLELIGDPHSSNRAAQRKVFNLLHKSVANKILKVKRRYADLN